jgi:ComF family protein
MIDIIKRSFRGLVEVLVPVEYDKQESEVLEFNFKNTKYINFSSSLWFQSIKAESGTCPIDKLLVSTKYSTPAIRNLIERAKFEGEWSIAFDFAKLIYQASQKQKLKAPQALLFVPGDPSRSNLRGYHLPKLLASELGRLLSVPVIDVFVKPKPTKSQVDMLDSSQRIQNLKNVFSLQESCQEVSDLNYLWLVDDVISTGTTLGEVASVIKKSYPKINLDAVVVAG